MTDIEKRRWARAEEMMLNGGIGDGRTPVEMLLAYQNVMLVDILGLLTEQVAYQRAARMGGTAMPTNFSCTTPGGFSYVVPFSAVGPETHSD